MSNLLRAGSLARACVLIGVATGCSASITRSGYTVPAAPVTSDCRTAIKYQFAAPADEVEVLGTVEAADSGFSVECDEEYVLTRLREDACGLGADVISITEERGPDFWSTCYRAKAEFLRLKNRDSAGAIASDPKYVGEELRERSAESGRRTRNAIVGGMVGGVVGAGIGSAIAP